MPAMELTNEDRVAIDEAAFGQWSDRKTVGELIYLAGLRAGMERAAKICEEQQDRDEPLWHEEDCANWSLGEAARTIREAAK